MDDKPPFLLAEIQIMTLTQFTFASLSHSLLYKNELNNSSVKDSLARISTLLNEVGSEINEKLKNKFSFFALKEEDLVHIIDNVSRKFT